MFLATSPADPSVVYKVRTELLATFSIWRSDDGGASWERKANPSEAPAGLMVHPADPDRVYVSYASLTGHGLVISTDGGETWRKYDQGQYFEALAGDPTDPDRIWAGNYSGLYLSEDGGVSFRQLSDTPTMAIAVDPADPDHLVLGGRALYESHDGGQTLTPATHVDLDMWVNDLRRECGVRRHRGVLRRAGRPAGWARSAGQPRRRRRLGVTQPGTSEPGHHQPDVQPGRPTPVRRHVRQ